MLQLSEGPHRISGLICKTRENRFRPLSSNHINDRSRPLRIEEVDQEALRLRARAQQRRDSFEWRIPSNRFCAEFCALRG